MFLTKAATAIAISFVFICTIDCLSQSGPVAIPANSPNSGSTNRGNWRKRERFVTEPAVLDWSHIPNAADADTLVAAFNRVFYVRGNGIGYFRASTMSNKPADFWKLAEEIEMVIDTSERSRNPAYSNQVVELIEGFDRLHADWTKNEFNDDVMWICIANLRGYQLTGNVKWRDHARASFEAIYARAWDTNFAGGGLFWKTENRSKNTCVNAPAAIAACLLWKTCGEVKYRDIANEIIDWNKKVLSDGHGWIYDSIRTNGTLNRVSFSYNQGTFIGACNFLGRTNDAAEVMDYAIHKQGITVKEFQILPPYRLSTDSAGFHGILLRWVARYMQDQHVEKAYLPWLQANALSAWSVRRPSDNLSWCDWVQKTPTNAVVELPSWACSASVVALQVCQTTQKR
jgi:predicted alpha-1,6-mannanase (GH76 family)